MELADLVRRLTKRGRSSQGFRHALAFHLPQQTELRMTHTAGPSAMTGRLATVARTSGHGSGTEIAEGQELLQQCRSCDLKVG